MPTIKPRYTLTDTGRLRELLDAAQARWPEITDRKALLLKLAEEGHSAIESAGERLTADERHAHTQAALNRIRSLVDSEALLSDRAWR